MAVVAEASRRQPVPNGRGRRARRAAVANPTPAKAPACGIGSRVVDPERARQLLSTERERIEETLARLADQDSGDLSDREEPADAASDLYQDELDEGLADDLREQLAAVERAEARLAAGSYGFSVESGEPILDERLEAIPTAERTAEEEARR
jgi:RNA polymerase-binding transcription factor